MKKIPHNILEAAAGLLNPYTGLTSEQLEQKINAGKPLSLPVMLDKHTAAKFLGLSWFSIVNMCKSGEIQAVKIKGVWRIPASEIERLAGVRGGENE